MVDPDDVDPGVARIELEHRIGLRAVLDVAPLDQTGRVVLAQDPGIATEGLLEAGRITATVPRPAVVVALPADAEDHVLAAALGHLARHRDIVAVEVAARRRHPVRRVAAGMQGLRQHGEPEGDPARHGADHGEAALVQPGHGRPGLARRPDRVGVGQPAAEGLELGDLVELAAGMPGHAGARAAAEGGGRGGRLDPSRGQGHRAGDATDQDTSRDRSLTARRRMHGQSSVQIWDGESQRLGSLSGRADRHRRMTCATIVRHGGGQRFPQRGICDTGDSTRTMRSISWSIRPWSCRRGSVRAGPQAGQKPVGP